METSEENILNNYILITSAIEFITKYEGSLKKALQVINLSGLGKDLTCFFIEHNKEVWPKKENSKEFYITEYLVAEILSKLILLPSDDNQNIPEKIKEKYSDYYWRKSDFFSNSVITSLLGGTTEKKSIPNKVDVNKLQKEKIDKEYIRLFSAIEFIRRSKDIKYEEMSHFLERVFSHLELYTLDSSLTPVTGIDFCDYNCMEHCISHLHNADENLMHRQLAYLSVDKYFWNKSDFFNNEEIINLNLTEKQYDLFLIASRYIPPIKNLQIENKDIEFLSTIIMKNIDDESALYKMRLNLLNEKISSLENENNLLKEHIENPDKITSVLEEPTKMDFFTFHHCEKKSHNNTENLIDFIFDESTTERYAPDLVHAIKLWEHIYINNPKNDSHSNMANQWIENNTSYSENQTGGKSSIDRIREITTPFGDWGNKRNKNHKK